MYELDWSEPGRNLWLRLDGAVSPEEFTAIDAQIAAFLDTVSRTIVLVVDASAVKVSPYAIPQIKQTQRYLLSRKISHLAVISTNKLNRLSMTLLFNPCRPALKICDDFEQAARFLAPATTSPAD